MKGTWEDVLLNEVSEDITVGHVGPMVDQYMVAGVPFLRSLNVEPFRINTTDLKYISADFHQRLKKSALRPGDVVIVRTGKPGSCAVIPDWLSDANCSDLVVVRPGPRVRPHYVSYVVNSTAGHHIDAHTVGAVQQHFNVASARQIRFRLPSLVEQDRILRVLQALDDKIDLNRRMNGTLEAMARSIFKDWFVDFGPTRAKIERRAPYLAPELWALFPDRLDDDGRPKGWKHEAVLDQANWINGAAYKNMHFVEPALGLPVVKIAELKNGVTSQTRFTNTDLGDRYRISDGEMLFSWSGNPDTSIDTFLWTGGGRMVEPAYLCGSR